MKPESIVKLFSGQGSAADIMNVEFDEIYSLWLLGYNLGEILIVLNESNYFSDPEKEKSKILEAIDFFRISYQKVILHSESLNEKDLPDHKNSIELLKNVESKDFNFNETFDIINNIKDNLAFEIQIFSTHLSNIFLFGYQLNKLKADIIKKDIEESYVKKSVDELINHIIKLEQGDKLFHTTNIEFTKVNLRILRIILKSLKKKLKEILKFNKDKLPDLINIVFFQKMTDIILDIRNPKQFARYKFLRFIVYYYLAISIIVLIDLLAKSNFAPEFLYLFGDSGEINFMEWLMYLFPLLLVLFRKLNSSCIIILIKWKINWQLRNKDRTLC